MAKAVRYHKQGGPEVLQLDDVQVGDPGQGQVRIKHTALLDSRPAADPRKPACCIPSVTRR